MKFRRWVPGLFLLIVITKGARSQSTIHALGGVTFHQATPIAADVEDAKELAISATPGFHVGFLWSTTRAPEVPSVALGLLFEQRNYQEEFTLAGGSFSSGNVQSRYWEEKDRVDVRAQFLLIPLTIGTKRPKGFGVRGGIYMAGLLSRTGSHSVDRITSVREYAPVDTSWVEVASWKKSRVGDGIRAMHWGVTLAVSYTWKWGLFLGATGFVAPLGVSDWQLHDSGYNCSAQISAGWCIVGQPKQPVENSP